MNHTLVTLKVYQGDVHKSSRFPDFTQDVYAAIHKGGLWLGPRFQAREVEVFSHQLHNGKMVQKSGQFTS